MTRGRLVQFLYLLGRDVCPLGQVEDLVLRTTPGDTIYTNRNLEAWAAEKAAELLMEEDLP